MITKEWIESFMNLTTYNWSKSAQSDILKGTGWLKGLNDDEIDQFEKDFGFKFPTDVRALLSVTGGLNKKQKQSGYVGSKEITRFVNRWHLNPNRTKEAIEFARSWIIKDTYDIIKEEQLIPIENQQYFFLLPIFAHRFVVCDQNNLDFSMVLSIYDHDIVIYGKDLREYLENEFLK